MIHITINFILEHTDVEGSSCPATGGLNNFINNISEHNEVGLLNAMVTGRLHNFIKDII